MVKYHLNRSSPLSVSVEDAFQWHKRSGALERMTPSWMRVRILEKSGTIFNGDTVTLKTYFGPISFILKMQHQNYIEGRQFEDIQIKGPFKYWTHTHLFEKIDDRKSKIIDKIEYDFLFSFINHRILEEKLNRLFVYRHRTLKNDLYLHSKYSQKKFKILITGASGLVGKDLVPFLKAGGHTVLKLVRDPVQVVDDECILWNKIEKKFVNEDKLIAIDAVVHLAGENIAAQKWSHERKSVLVESRVHFTRDLCLALSKLETLPKVFVSASGIGIFGKRDYDDILHEDSRVGEGFLAKLAQDWEAAAELASEKGIRVVHLRFGSIISMGGGILKKMLTPYQLCLGGSFGSGRQMMPWVSITDVLGLILFSLSNEQVVGPVNAVAPHAVTNEQFSQLLAETLDRPSSLRIPEIVVESIFGEMGRELLLSGQHAKPIKATKNGYEFMHSELLDAFSYCLGS